MGLSGHVNVFNTCLRILSEKGYAVRVTADEEWRTRLPTVRELAVRAVFKVPGEQDDGQHPLRCFWIAEKDGFYFCAGNPIELLGLVAVRDHVQPTKDREYWWRREGPDLLNEFMDRAFGDGSNETKK